MSTETFRQSEEQFRALIEHSTEAIALFSPDGIILYASPSSERVTGYTADELVGMNSFSFVHPHDLEEVRERLASLLDQPGAFSTLEYRFRHRDGTFRWMEGIVSNCLADPTIGAIVSNYRDITQPKQAEAERDRALVQVASREREIEAALRRREEQLRLIIDGLPLFISYVDTEHRYQFTNRMHERWFGLREQEIRGCHASQVLGSRRYEEVRPYLERALGGEEEVQFEARSLERDGSRGYVHIHYIPDRDEQGQVRGCIVLVADITERKRQEEALRASEERYRTIVQTANEGIWLIDRGAGTLYTNDRMAQMLGYTTAEMCEHTVPEFVFPGDEPKAAERISNNLAGNFEQFEFRFRRRDGSVLDTLACTSPMRDGQGRIVGALGMFTDITEQRLLERRTHEALDALLAIAESLVTVPPASEVTPALPTTTPLAHRLLELTCQVMGCENATFVSREPDTDAAHLVASVGFTAEQERIIQASVEGTRFADRYQDPAFLARLHAGEVQLLDLSRPPYRDQRPLPSLRQAMVVPIRLGEVLVGVISLNHVDSLYEYTSADLALAQGTARLAGLVIERERLLRERAEAQARALAALQANQHMDTFLGMVGHELKTPLTAVKGNLQIVKRRLAAALREVPTRRQRFENLWKRCRFCSSGLSASLGWRIAW
jgi:PAS domain S-box-containing protein